MDRDGPEKPKPRSLPFRLAQNPRNPQVNLVQPQVAAVTRTQARIQLEEQPKENRHQREWRELKAGSTQITKGLRKQASVQEDATLEKFGPGKMRWVKKVAPDSGSRRR